VANKEGREDNKEDKEVNKEGREGKEVNKEDKINLQCQILALDSLRLLANHQVCSKYNFFLAVILTIASCYST
jgi:hypothetical protein